MFKILVSDSLSEEGLKILNEVKEFQVDVKTGMKPEELKAVIKDYDALLVRSATKATKEIIQAADNLKVIGRAGVGLDNVDLAAATERGIVVMNAPAGNTISTCEHTMSMLLSLARSIPQANASTKKGEWKRSKFMGMELYKKTLGIIGLGRIGREVARRAASFGMKIKGYDPFLSRDLANTLGIEVVELDDLLKEADFITVHVPLTDDTNHMISDKQFALMKKGVRVLNCARGGIIDEQALIKAVKEGKVAGAALDVFETEPPDPANELLKLDTVIVTCHLGASTEEAQVNVAIEIAECAKDFLLGKGIRNAANYPNIDPELYKILQPYIVMAEKLGSFGAQMIEGRLEEVEIQISGDIAKYNTTSLSMALVRGMLMPVLKEAVNYINAMPLARSRGIQIKETKVGAAPDFVNLVTLTLKTDKETRTCAATLSPKREPRIAKIDDFYVEAAPEGYLLVMKNWDKPGIIGNVGTLMGQNKINIAAMVFGRKIQGDIAVSILNVDSPISPELIEKLKKIENILAVRLVKL
ncbi:MAG TPA: phosphoglycerate dehydrogenase [Candidatus Omnitrophota bacterium]|nr:phosphoglycerate dehydrogenase [Candidatus Omnitrophota bacterium]HRZ15435.1 phosphoglycerate dehydrogenase [Candidatus Omnitrophota bacterium]